MSEETESAAARQMADGVRNTGDTAMASKPGGLPRADKVLPAKTSALPESAPMSSPATAPPVPRNPVFDDLVTAEDDICGLLAYALFEQNKRDWLASHTDVRGREPTPEEFDAYIIGERIPRRLDTYRRLAQDMLSRNKGAGVSLPQSLSGSAPVASAGQANTPAHRDNPAAATGLKTTGGLRTMGLLLAGVVVIALVVRYAAGPLLGLP